MTAREQKLKPAIPESPSPDAPSDTGNIDSTERWLEGQTRVLEQLARGDSLLVVLGTLIRTIETHVDGMLGSVLLRDDGHLRLAVAPGLPADFNQAMDGVRIGPDVGSCGTAAHHNRLVITEDVLTDPRWREYRDLATRHGIRACWSQPICSSNGEVLGTFALYHDHPRRPSPIELARIRTAAHVAGIAIERREFERVLFHEQELLRVLLDNIPDAIYFKDREGRFTRINRAQARFIGVAEPDDAVGRLDAEFFPPAIAAGYLADDLRVVDRGEPLTGRIESNGQDGLRQRWFLTTKVPIRDSAGVVNGLVGISRDVTEVKKAQDEQRRLLEDTASGFNAIFEAYPDLQFRLLADGTIVDHHASERSDVHLSSGELRGRRIQDVMPADVAPRFEDAIRTVKRTGTLVSVEYRLFRSNCPRIYEARILPLGNDELIVISRDITERKQAEEQNRINQERLRSLASELSLAEERQRHRIAADLHDQIGQTLISAQLKLKTLLRSLPADGSGATLRDCIDLLELTIKDTRTLMFDLSPPVLYDLGLEAAAEWLTEQHQQRTGVPVRFHDDGSPKPIDEALRVTLFRALRELLINVEKHASARNVEVLIQRGDNQIRMQITDDGVGFDASALRTRIDDAKAFGLFSIDEQLGRLGGRVEVHSTPGAGTRVVVWGPLEQHEPATLAAT